jgi:hypothetical protein
MASSSDGPLLPVLDTRQVSKPSNFDGDPNSWREWKFKFLNYCTLLSPEYDDFLTASETSVDPIPMQADAVRKRLQTVLFALLASLLSGKPLKLLQLQAERNGFESWRLLCREFEPRLPQRRLALLHSLMAPNFSGDFETQLITWEREIAVYEKVTGKTFDDDLRMAVLLRHSPPGLREHLQLSAGQFDEDYSKMRTVIQLWLQTRQSFAALNNAPVPMDIGYLGKGKGKCLEHPLFSLCRRPAGTVVISPCRHDM